MKISSIIGGLVLLLVFYFVVLKPDPSPDNPDNPTGGVTYVAPSGEMQTVVVEVKKFRGKKNASLVAKFYYDFANVLSRDTQGIVKTKEQFRNAHMRAQQLAFVGTDVQGSLPGLNQAIDAALGQAMGLDQGELNKPRTIEVLNAIAWALGG